VSVYSIKNAPGLFRYGLAFGLKNQTEIGWGAQTTLLSLMMLPFIFAHQAGMILYGNEYLNNDYEYKNGWMLYHSFDQTSHWTTQQDNIIRLLTNNQCRVHSSLEPLEEINIFYLLHHRYQEIGKYQFSCGSTQPLLSGSQWCHQCYKCSRMFLFAQALGIEPSSIGFKHNLFKRKNMFKDYFDKNYKTRSSQDLDFAFYLAHKKGLLQNYEKIFIEKKLNKQKNWPGYYNYFTKPQPALNLPPNYQAKMKQIFRQELKNFKKNITAIAK